MVSSTTCTYCELLKQEVLKPLQRNPDYDRKLTLRELLLDSEQAACWHRRQRDLCKCISPSTIALTRCRQYCFWMPQDMRSLNG